MRTHISLYISAAIQLPLLALAVQIANPIQFPPGFQKRQEERQRNLEADAKCIKPDLRTTVATDSPCFDLARAGFQCLYGIDLREQERVELDLTEEDPADVKRCICASNSDYYTSSTKCFDCFKREGGVEGVQWYQEDYRVTLSSSYCAPTQTVGVIAFESSFGAAYMQTAFSISTTAATTTTAEPKETANSAGSSLSARKGKLSTLIGAGVLVAVLL